MNYNSKVNVDQVNNLTSYKFFADNKSNFDLNTQSIKNIHTENPVSELFFSKHNISVLQNGIRYSVYIKTNNLSVIGNQSEFELMIIMRSIYLQYCKHKQYDIVGQVKELNSKVLDYAVPKILVELNQYINYKRDASTLPMPLEHSKNVSQSGTRILYTREF